MTINEKHDDTRQFEAVENEKNKHKKKVFFFWDEKNEKFFFGNC